MTQMPLLFPDPLIIADAPELPLHEQTPCAIRDRILDAVEQKAGESFNERARAFVLEHLRGGPATGEQIVDAGSEAGVIADEPRAWGPVFMRLSRGGQIVKCGHAQRRKGHGTAGGNVWRLA